MKTIQRILGFVAMVFIMSSSLCHAQEWAISYGGSGLDSPNAVQETSGGGYVVAGYTTSFGGEDVDVWLLNLGANGQILWEKVYGGDETDSARAVRQTSGGGYVVAGGTISSGAGDWDFLVLKLDASGEIVWQKTYGGANREIPNSIQQTSDGGYVVSGSTYTFGQGRGDVWVIRLSPDGEVVWQKAIGGEWLDYAVDAQETADGGFIVSGKTYSFGQDSDDLWVLKLSSGGAVEWQKTYGGNDADSEGHIKETSDGYIVAGTTMSFGAGWQDMWVLKLASDGSIVWQKTYGKAGSSELVSSVEEASDGGYIVSGWASVGPEFEDIWILKLSSDGSVAWQKTYDGGGSDSSANIQRTSDNGYILAGRSNSFTEDSGDFWVLKLNVNGDIPNCSIMGSDSVTVSDTFVFAEDSLGESEATTVEAADAVAVSQNTSALVFEQCAAPDADFMADSVGGPAPFTVQFTDQSSGIMTSWYWDFGDGGDSTEQNPSYTFETEGDFTVSLTVDGLHGNDTETKTDFIQVVPPGSGPHVWPDPTPGSTPIQDAIDIAATGETILVHDGTYMETISIDKSVTIQSENGPDVTIIDGSDTGLDVVTFGWGSEGALVGGLTIRNGYSGVWFGSSNFPATVVDCIITNNSYGVFGAVDSMGTVTGCLLSNNSENGVVLCQSELTLSDCIITGNGEDGIVDWCGGGGLSMSKCDISLNNGFGVDLGSGYGYTAATISNCVISENASTAFSYYAYHSTGTLVNSTIVGNGAFGIRCQGPGTDSNFMVANTILRNNNNSGVQISADPGADESMSVTFSNVEGGWLGEGNIDCNPDFVGSNDYHLLGSSCCINAGTSDGAPGEDIDGDVRPQGGGYDIGADEYYPIHAGFVVLDKEVYGPSIDISVLVTDSDLNTDSGQTEQYANLVTITTDHDGTVYDIESTITMTETGPATGAFTGTIGVAHSSATPENDILEIDCQTPETIIVTYHDMDDGTENEAFPSDTADTDCASPVISNVQVTHTGYTVAVISWDTDEAADSTLNYGPTESLGSSEHDSSLSISHTIHLTGLTPDTTYYFEIVSADEVGNQATDDNGGQYYQFQTALLPVQQWAITYGGSAHDTVYSVEQTFDEWGDINGYITAGNTYSFGNGHDDYWVVRLDLSGSILWEKSYGTDTFEWAVSADQTADGGYFVAGNSYYHNYDGRDFWFLKLNPDGSSAWQNIYGSSSGNDYAYAAQETFDESGNSDGYVMAGFTASFGAGEGDVWVLKLNSSGGISWQKTYGGNAHDGGYDIHQTSDGGYVVAGTTESFAGTEQDMFVLKLNQNGGVEWQKAYDYGGYERANTVRQTADGGYVVAGETGMMYEADVLILKLDPDGNVTWSKTYSALYQDDAKAIRETSDGNYAVAGWTMPAGGGGQQFWVLKLDSEDGSLLWQKSYGGAGYDGANSIEETVDGGLIVGGASSFGEGSSDMWLLKLDENGDIPGCDISNPGDGIVSDAEITVTGTNASVNDSQVAPTSTSILPHDTSAVTWDMCAAPTADFSADVTSGTKPLAVAFTDESTGAIATWSWDFDNDGTEDSAEQNPSHEYAEAGDYTVSLTVTGPGGSDSEAKANYIHVTDSICECNLVPDNTTVSRGGTLGFQVSVTNNTSGGRGMVLFGTKVTKPDASQTGFIWGPLQVYLNPHQTKSGHKTHTIPVGFELGTYTYHGYVGRFGNIYDECQFEFEVVSE